jgi:hypothetical protein
MVLGNGFISTGPAAGEGYDAESLFWRHERLHRLVLGDYARRRALLEVERHAMEAGFLSLCNGTQPAAAECQRAWEEHCAVLPLWSERIARASVRDRRSWPARRYWRQQNLLDKLP